LLDLVWEVSHAPQLLPSFFSTHLCRAQNDGADVGVAGRPGKTELRDGTAELLGHGRQLLDLFDLGLALGRLELLDGALEESLVRGEAAVLGQFAVGDFVVLSCEETRGKWGPDGGAVLELVKQRSILDLHAVAVERVVLVLLDDWCNEARETSV